MLSNSALVSGGRSQLVCIQPSEPLVRAHALQAAFPKRGRKMMSEPDNASTWPSAMIPPDDPKRQFTIADPDGPRARHVSVSGSTFTILVNAGARAGRYCLIDMLVSPDSRP